MLETINLLVGLAVVMLLVSFAVTLLTQLVVGLMNLRGWALRLKIKNLLVLVDNGIHPRDAAQISGLVLRNALIAQPGLLPGMGLRPAAVVHREELTRLLLAFGKLPSEYPAEWRWLFRRLNTADLQQKMRASLTGNGVDSPEDFLATIQQKALELEQTQPQMSNAERVNTAILSYGSNRFIGKMFGWFDQTVERASDLFTGWTQIAAFLVAACLAVVLQLDTLGLVNQLSADPALRNELVEWAVKHVDTASDAVNSVAAAAPSSAGGDGDEAAQTLKPEVLSAAQSALFSNGLIDVPTGWTEWQARWSGPVTSCAHAASAPATAKPDGGACRLLPQVSVAGVALSALLLSLGGPFWYAVLKNLLKLRSTVAGKEEDERQIRQASQSATPDGAVALGSVALAPELAGGEAGDLTAMG